MRLVFYLFTVLLFFTNVKAENITHIQIQNAVSPASAAYLKDAFLHAKNNNSKLLILELDTPGGLATSMREMIQDILNSPIPVVVFVSPKGSRAASAGTFLAYASHVSVMAPGTNIGAATPVNLISTPKTTAKKNPTKEDSDKKDEKTAMQKKVFNDAVAYITSIAQLRKRNIDWATQAVLEGKSISAQDALDKNVIDYMANDLDDLLKIIDGTSVTINDELILINTKNANIIYFEATWKTKFFMTISNPSVAYIFLIIAMYGIMFEMMSPGSIFPGVIGAISAMIALYSLNILPFNYVGLFLIFLGVSFMIAEVFIAGIGILGIGGVVAFAIGSIMLFDPNVLGTAVSIPLVASFSLVSFSFFIYLLRFLMNSRKNGAMNAYDNLIGEEAKVIQLTSSGYKVSLQGEIWDAKSSELFNIGELVIIESTEGLSLNIRGEK